ncbi:protein disulfide-isomerase 1-like [Tubulanus polymorphus]|uniref:protein disulfide-isomerase 1-like n=1 Tax=Tubulanus polymorphus TaxID=672921 RepID=UPI003DA3B25E
MFKIFVCVSLLIVAASALDGRMESLSSKNFDGKVLKSSEPVMVKFFAPWCGWCKKMAPEFVAAAKQLSGQQVTLAEVDCTKNRPLCSKYGVRGYPTLLVFPKKGSVTSVKYQGSRTSAAFVSYMKKFL